MLSFNKIIRPIVLIALPSTQIILTRRYGNITLKPKNVYIIFKQKILTNLHFSFVKVCIVSGELWWRFQSDNSFCFSLNDNVI